METLIKDAYLLFWVEKIGGVIMKVWKIWLTFVLIIVTFFVSIFCFFYYWNTTMGEGTTKNIDAFLFRKKIQY